MQNIITLEDVKRGIESGIVKFVRVFDSTVCQIGQFWFYFLSGADYEMQLEEFKEKYSTEELAERVYNAIIDWKTTGLDEAEAYYYYSVLIGCQI